MSGGDSLLRSTPSFEDICHKFDQLVDMMVESVTKLPRVEHRLFEKVDQLGVTYIPCVELDQTIVREEIIENAKRDISRIVMANSAGPTK